MARNRNRNQAADTSNAGDDGDAVNTGTEEAAVASETTEATKPAARNRALAKVETLTLEECEAELERIGDPDIKFQALAAELTALDVAHQAVVEEYNTKRNAIKLAKHEEGIKRNDIRERMRLINIRLPQLKAEQAAGLI